MIDLFDDGPDIVVKSEFFTASHSTWIFEQLKAQIRWRQVMRGTTQHNWVHRVPKETGSASRINLTFRFIQ